MTMTPQANHAPEHGLGRQGSVYDRLRAEWQAAGRTVPGAIWGAPGQQPWRSSAGGQGAKQESFRRLNGTHGGWTEQGTLNP